jgi:hypothetical protein
MIHVPEQPACRSAFGDTQVQSSAIANQSVLCFWAKLKVFDFSDFGFDLEIG